MKFLLSNNGNGDAYAAVGDLTGDFFLWDGSTKYPQGHGVPKNWIWVKDDHPKVQANLKALTPIPASTGQARRVEPVEVKKPWPIGEVEESNVRINEDTDEFEPVDIPDDEPQVFQQGDSPDDEIE